MELRAAVRELVAQRRVSSWPLLLRKGIYANIRRRGVSVSEKQEEKRERRREEDEGISGYCCLAYIVKRELYTLHVAHR